MSKNLKLGNTTYSNVDVVKIENADSSGQYIDFVPVTKLSVGTVVINFVFDQDFTGDGTRKITWRPVLLTTSGNWHIGSYAYWNTYTINYLSDWKTYTLTQSDEQVISEQIIIHIDSSQMSTNTGYTGFGILIDLTNSKYDYLGANFYSYGSEAYVQNLNNPLNGLNIYTRNNEGLPICGPYIVDNQASNATLRMVAQNGVIGSSTSSAKSIAESKCIIINFNVTGAED